MVSLRRYIWIHLLHRLLTYMFVPGTRQTVGIDHLSTVVFSHHHDACLEGHVSSSPSTPAFSFVRNQPRFSLSYDISFRGNVVDEGLPPHAAVMGFEIERNVFGFRRGLPGDGPARSRSFRARMCPKDRQAERPRGSSRIAVRSQQLSGERGQSAVGRSGLDGTRKRNKNCGEMPI